MRYFRIRTGSQYMDEAIARTAIDFRSALGGGHRYQKFVIVGTARTGSTLLLNLLNAHRNALAFGELFRGDGRIGWDAEPFLSYQKQRFVRLLETRPLDFLDRAVFRRWPREICAVGFKLFYYHARDGAQAAVWDYIRSQPEILIIHIKRLNILEQYLSLTVAHATNIWSMSGRPPVAADPIRLDPNNCRHHFEEVRAYERDCDSYFAGRQVETVTYEQLVADRSEVMRRLFAKLGLPAEPVEARIVRQRSQRLSQAISNYEELRACFAGMAWEGFFCQSDTVTTSETISNDGD
jgi:LPS sulfotransferase NodH